MPEIFLDQGGALGFQIDNSGIVLSGLVGLPFDGIAQNFISFGNGPELGRISLPVRVVFPNKLTVGIFDFPLRSGLRDSQISMIILFHWRGWSMEDGATKRYIIPSLNDAAPLAASVGLSDRIAGRQKSA